MHAMPPVAARAEISLRGRPTQAGRLRRAMVLSAIRIGPAVYHMGPAGAQGLGRAGRGRAGQLGMRLSNG